MIKDYAVIDNVFDNAKSILDKFKSVEYFSNEETNLPDVKITSTGNKPNGNWRGFRSNAIHTFDEEFFKALSETVFSKLFKCSKFSWFGETYFHLSPASIVKDANWWHVDHYPYAGVIYMNEDPDKDAGTVLNIGNRIINIENKFNRLVFYRGDILHRPGNTFGSDFQSVRKTITIFVHTLQLEY